MIYKIPFKVKRFLPGHPEIVTATSLNLQFFHNREILPCVYARRLTIKRSDVKWAGMIFPAFSIRNPGYFMFILTPDHERVAYIRELESNFPF